MFLKCASVATALAFSVAAYGETKSLGERIVAFCKANKDKQVGDGECSALARLAIEAAHGKPHSKYRDNPNKGDYVWGKLVFAIEFGESGLKRTGKERDVLPGDVIQFRDAKFVWKTGGRSHSESCPHHTAVVASVEEDGTILKIFHQNSGGKRFVVDGVIHVEEIKSGWMRVYRANPK